MSDPQNLTEQTWKSHRDYFNLKESHQAIMELNEFVNLHVSLEDRMKKMAKLQERSLAPCL